MPGGDGELVDRAGGDVAAPALDEAGDDLDVEDPAGEERLGEDVAQIAAGAEELRPALGVVDGQAERARDERRPHPPDVVPRRAAADGTAQEPDPGTGDHSALGTGGADG